jgi:hypothetical protein
MTTATAHDPDLQAINALHELTLRVHCMQRDASDILHELDEALNNLAGRLGLEFNEVKGVYERGLQSDR